MHMPKAAALLLLLPLLGCTTTSSERAWLGANAVEDAALLVDRVDQDGPADRSGLREGDTISALDGQPVASLAELRLAVDGRAPGSTVTLDVLRAGEPLALQVKLGKETVVSGGEFTLGLPLTLLALPEGDRSGFSLLGVGFFCDDARQRRLASAKRRGPLQEYWHLNLGVLSVRSGVRVVSQEP